MICDEKNIDAFAEELLREGRKFEALGEEYVNPFKPDMYVFQSVCANLFVKLQREGAQPFYAYFQPCYDRPAPLLVHMPGYGAEMSFHPDMAQRYNVLHISPLGYNTPEGKDGSKLTMGGCGPVYPNTLLGDMENGYVGWLKDCVAAVEWARGRENVISDRIGFFGTSQGGGGSLLMTSIYRDENVVRAVAAEQPFLTDFKRAAWRGAYAMGEDMWREVPEAVRLERTFCIDTVNHARRICCPVLLTSGGRDETCPPETAKALFEALEGSKSYTHFEHLPHGYSREFLPMARAWFEIYL